MLTRRSAAAGLLSSGIASRISWAQEWPRRPVTIVHGFGAGGNADSISRVVANALSADLGVSFIVEAKPGAGGNLASAAVAHAEPDGYTIILLTGGHAVSAALYKDLRFKPVEDFAFVSLVATFPFVIAVRTDSPIKSIADLIAAARKEPDKLTFSSVGIGSTQHLTGELFQETAGIKLRHVPYRGGTQPLTDLLGGNIDVMIDTITVTGGAIRAGAIRALATTSRDPWPALPDVPPISAAVPGFEVRSWIGIAAPAATPLAVIGRLNAALGKVLRSPDVKEQLGTLGVLPEASTPGAMRDFVAAEIARWSGLIGRAGIQRL